MLRPWVPLIALALLAALAWRLGPGLLAGAGGLLLAAALLSSLAGPLSRAWARLGEGRRRARALRQATALDWKLIENAAAESRPTQDCERPETLGICTGRDCLAWETCNFAIKKRYS